MDKLDTCKFNQVKSLKQAEGGKNDEVKQMKAGNVLFMSLEDELGEISKPDLTIKKTVQNSNFSFKAEGLKISDINPALLAYKMKKSNKGYFVIFNLFPTDIMIAQKATENLEQVAQFLGFNKLHTKVKDVYSPDDVEAGIEWLSQSNHSNFDCLVCVVLGFGNVENVLATNDGDTISINKIMEQFEPKYCPSLVGKPKMYFVETVPVELKMTLDEDCIEGKLNLNKITKTQPIKIPLSRDNFLCHAVTNTLDLPFISCLCNGLKAYGNCTDITQLLTFVNGMLCHGQMPASSLTIVSALTASVIFKTV